MDIQIPQSRLLTNPKRVEYKRYLVLNDDSRLEAYIERRGVITFIGVFQKELEAWCSINRHLSNIRVINPPPH